MLTRRSTFLLTVAPLLLQSGRGEASSEGRRRPPAADPGQAPGQVRAGEEQARSAEGTGRRKRGGKIRGEIFGENNRGEILGKKLRRVAPRVGKAPTKYVLARSKKYSCESRIVLCFP